MQPSPLALVPAGAPDVPGTLPDSEATRLMARFRDQRTESDFDALYRATRAGLLAWIVKLVRRRRTSLDPFEVLQDTFVNIYRYAGGFRDDEPASFRRWARTIAGNVVRRAGIRLRPALTLGSLSEEGDAPLDVEDPRPGPAYLAEADEASELCARSYRLFLLHYARAFAELAPRDREALRLVEVEGLDYRAVGERLGTRPSNTKMIVFRARARLRARMLRAFEGSQTAERMAS